MKIKIADLTEENLKDLPEFEDPPYSCKYCIYWIDPEKFLSTSEIPREELYKIKLNWLKGISKKTGSPGKIMYADGIPVGFAQFAPRNIFKGFLKEYKAKVHKDAAYLACLYIFQKENRNKGLGEKLLESVLKEIKKRGFKAVETFGRKENDDNPSGPYEFYEKNKFNIALDDPEFPLLRREL